MKAILEYYIKEKKLDLECINSELSSHEDDLFYN